jgi:hypothetical protein
MDPIKKSELSDLLLEMCFRKEIIEKVLKIAKSEEEAVHLALEFQENPELLTKTDKVPEKPIKQEVTKETKKVEQEKAPEIKKNIIEEDNSTTKQTKTIDPPKEEKDKSKPMEKQEGNLDENKMELKKENKKRKRVKPDFYRMVVVVRTDLGMKKGKIAAQVGHAGKLFINPHPLNV